MTAITTKADLAAQAAHLMDGFPYELGRESSPSGLPDTRYDVGEPSTPAKPGDCSGDYWAILIYAGITINGRPVTKADRRTANGWWHYPGIIHLDKPEKCGDGFVLLGAGTDHAHHIGMYLGVSAAGKTEVFEMGDGTGKAGIHTVAHENARAGIRWFRIPGMDFEAPAPTAAAPYQDWPEVLKNPSHGPHVGLFKIWMNAVMGTHLDPKNPTLVPPARRPPSRSRK